MFGEEHAQVPLDQATEVQVLALPRPAFAFSYSVTSHHSPEDGLPHVGDEFELKVDVTNEGAGSALSSLAILKNLGDEKIFLKKGREKLGVLKPGETKTATFEVALLKGYHGDTVPLRMQILDDQLDEFVGEKLNLPVAPETMVSKARAGTVKLQQSGPLVLTRPSQGSPPIAQVKKGLVLTEVGKVDSFYAVEWKPGRIGFLPESLATEVKAKPGAATEVMEFEPPKITVAGLDGAAAAAPVADGDLFPLSVSVTGPRPVRDVYVFVNEQKVFFHAAGKGEDPIAFERSLPLKPGNNTVLIVAREDDDFAAQALVRGLAARQGDDEVAKRQRQRGESAVTRAAWPSRPTPARRPAPPASSFAVPSGGSRLAADDLVAPAALPAQSASPSQIDWCSPGLATVLLNEGGGHWVADAPARRRRS